MGIEEYITTLTEQIRCKQARQGVAQEIRNHIADQTQAYEQDGMEHEKAEEKAVCTMGDPVEAGMALDRIHRPQFDWRLFLMTALFGIAGTFLVYFTGALAEGALTRQLLYTFLGLVITLAVCFIDYTFIGKYALPTYIFISLAFILYYKNSTQVNGCIPALRSMTYLYVPLYAGILYRYRGGRFGSIIKVMIFLLITVALSLSLSDSTFVSMNIGILCACLLLYAICKGWFAVNKKRTILLISLSVIALLAGYLALFTARYQRLRLIAFLNPESYQYGAAYQSVLMRRAIINARLIGGGEQIIDKQLVQNDTLFIFAQTIAMYGMAAGAAIITAFTMLLYHALKIVKHQKNQLGMMMSAACFLVVLLQCVVGVLMNVGLYPIGTLQFPFLNTGGSIAVMYAVLIGLIMSCQRYEQTALTESKAYRPKWEISVSVRRRD